MAIGTAVPATSARTARVRIAACHAARPALTSTRRFVAAADADHTGQRVVGLAAAHIHHRAGRRHRHSTFGITLDTYSRVTPTMQEEAAKRIDSALRAAMKRRKAD